MGFKDLLFKKGEDKPKPDLQPTRVVPVATIPTNELSNDYEKLFDDVVRGADQPGPDFKEFTESISKMSGTEQQKYTNTYIAYESMGLTKDKLAASGEYYLEQIEAVKANFDKELISARTQKIESKNKKIEEARAKMEELNQLITKLSLEVQNDTSNLAIKEAGFNSAYQNRKALITQQINNIKSYL